MRIAVTGGRKFNDRNFVFRKLDEFHVKYNTTELAHGGARGLDRLAKEWATSRSIPQREFLANWDLGKRAGHARNYEMLMEFKPDMLVHFPGETGTADCVKQAARLGIRRFDATTGRLSQTLT